MSAPPYMRLYWGDYSRKTRHLKRAAEHGAYFLLIGALWDANGKLPADDQTLADHALLTAKEWEAMKPRIMPFFKVSRGFITQARVTEELAKYRDTSGKRKQAGKVGGSVSAGKQALNPEAFAKQMPTQSESESKEERTPSPQGGEVDLKRFAKALSVAADAGCGFPVLIDRIHQAQPVVEGKRRSTKPDVQRALGGAMKRGGMPSAIWGAVQAYYALPASTKDGGQYAHGAAVILNRDRWKEFEAPAAGAPSSAPITPTFNAPQVRASIVAATDEDFARRYLDHYCRWDQGNRRLEARTATVAAELSRTLSGWAERYEVTITVAAANDAPAREAEGAAA